MGTTLHIVPSEGEARFLGWCSQFLNAGCPGKGQGLRQGREQTGVASCQHPQSGGKKTFVLTGTQIWGVPTSTSQPHTEAQTWENETPTPISTPLTFKKSDMYVYFLKTRIRKKEGNRYQHWISYLFLSLRRTRELN